MADRLKKVEAWLEDGNTAAARLALEQALSERPKDARVRYMLGRVAYAEDKHQEALAHYREAIALDAGFRGDPVLLAHVDALLAEPRQADAALDLVIEQIGAPGGRPAGEGRQRGERLAAPPARRRRARRDRRRASGSIACRWRCSSSRRRATCEEKKVLVEKLRELGDARALPALRALRGRAAGPAALGRRRHALHEEGAGRRHRGAGRQSRRASEGGPPRAQDAPWPRPMKPMRYDPRNLLTSLVLVFPLFLIYQVGVLFTLPVLNGADFLTVFLFRNLGLSDRRYLGYTVAVAVAFAIAVAVLRRKQRFDPQARSSRCWSRARSTR